MKFCGTFSMRNFAGTLIALENLTVRLASTCGTDVDNHVQAASAKASFHGQPAYAYKTWHGP